MKKTLAIAAFLGLAASASAYTVTYNNSVTINEGVNTVLTLPKFNISGMTLQSITLNIQFSVPSFDTAIDNDSNNAATGTISFSTLGAPTFSSSVSTLNTTFTDFIDATDFAIATQSDTLSVSGTTGDDTGTFDAPPTTSTDYDTFTTAPVLAGDTGHLINPGVFAQYIGAGNLSFTLNVDFVTDFNLNSGGGGGGETRFQGTVPSVDYFGSVTYTYIPEPSTALFLGLVGAGTVLRRRRA